VTQTHISLKLAQTGLYADTKIAIINPIWTKNKSKRKETKTVYTNSHQHHSIGQQQQQNCIKHHCPIYLDKKTNINKN